MITEKYLTEVIEEIDRRLAGGELERRLAIVNKELQEIAVTKRPSVVQKERRAYLHDYVRSLSGTLHDPVLWREALNRFRVACVNQLSAIQGEGEGEYDA